MKLVTDNSKGVVQRDRLLDLHEVERISGMKKSTIYMMMKAGTFPAGIKVGPRCVRWPETRVYQWVQDIIANGPVVRTQQDAAA